VAGIAMLARALSQLFLALPLITPLKIWRVRQPGSQSGKLLVKILDIGTA
jgi:hypothetical protein